jgi:uncharacterized protein YfdQ (DUF2303 family)
MTTRTDTDALVEALEGNEIPAQLLPGDVYAFKLRNEVRVIDLRDPDEKRPARKKGIVRVDDAASFIHYYAKHCDDASEVYVDIDAGRFTAVLDAHEGNMDVAGDPDGVPAARWGEHRLVLTMAQTDKWQRWTGIDRKMLPQERFADFIDDNRADIRKPSAADMLELVQHFQTQTKVTFNSATVLSNGNRRLTFTEETSAGAGAKQNLEVPSMLELGIAPYDGSEPYEVHARFRYRVSGGDLLMGIWLDDADDVRRDAVKIEASTVRGGGLPTPGPGASITVTERQAGRVVVSTWETCLGVSAFVASFLGEPSARAETVPRTSPACCRCLPAQCASDESGDHCATAGCAVCLDGCPAPDGARCCQEGSA